MNLLKILLVYLGLLVPLTSTVYSQSRVNRPRQKLSNHPIPTQLQHDLELAESYRKSSQFDSLYNLLQKSLPLAIRSHAPSATARLYFYLGTYYRFRRGQFEASIQAFKQSQSLLERLNDSTYLPRVLYTLGIDYFDQGNYQQASKQALTNLAYFEKRKLTDWIAYTCTTLRSIYLALKDKDRAKFYTDKFFQVSPRSTEPQIWLTNYDLKASLYEEAGKYALAQPYREKFLTVCRKAGKPIDLVDGLIGMATNLRKQNRLVQALAYLRQARQLSRRVRSEAYLAFISTEESQNYRQLHRPRLALKRAQEAIMFSDQSKNRNSSLDALTNLARLQEQMGDFRSALRSWKRQRTLSDTLTNLKKTATIAQLQTKYDVEKKENAIQLLTKNIQIQQLRSRQQSQQLNLVQQRQLVFVVSLITLSLLLGTIGYLLYQARLSQKQLTRQRNAIESQAHELQKVIQLKNQLFSVIGHDLRSPVANLQVRLNLLKAFPINPKSDELLRLEQEVSSLQHTLDNLLYWSLEQQNGLKIRYLSANLPELASDVLAGFAGLIQLKQLRIVFDQQPCFVQTDENLTLLILRNLLDNAIKFSPVGGRLYLSSAHSEEGVHFLIRDEGMGMDVKRQAPIGYQVGRGTGLGLQLSQELMDRMGGHLTIQSQLGQGTTVTLSWPTRSAPL